MFQRIRKRLALMGGFIITLAGAMPARGWSLIGQAYEATKLYPYRAIAIVVGIALVVYSLWDKILETFGVLTRRRVESDVRRWLEAFRFSIKVETNEKAYFEFVATPELGPAMAVGHFKELDRYVIIEGRVKLSDDDKKFFDGLADGEQAALGGALGIFMSRSRASYKYELKANEILIQRRVPITPDLSEHLFVTAVEDFMNARSGALNALVMLISSARNAQASVKATVETEQAMAKQPSLS